MSERGETEENPGAPFGVDESVAPIEARHSARRPACAEFMRRFACTVLDCLIIDGVLAFLLCVACIVMILAELMRWNMPDFARVNGWNAALTAFIWLGYFTVMDSSRRRGSYGKLYGGLEVVTLSGAQISFLRALWRNAVKLLEAFMGVMGFVTAMKCFNEHEPLWKTVGAGIVVILCAGAFFMARFTKQKQALHDVLAGTLVVKTHDI